MPNCLWMVIVIMLSFVPSGYHMGLLLRHLSTSLMIGLAFGIFDQIMGRFHGPCEYFFCELPMFFLLFCAFKIIKCPFSLNFHL
jgi:hypothetical protein